MSAFAYVVKLDGERPIITPDDAEMLLIDQQRPVPGLQNILRVLRRAWLAIVSMLGMAACVAAVMSSMVSPSWAADKGMPFLDIRVDGMPPGAIKTFQWGGQSFLIVRTTGDMLDDLHDQTRNTWSQRPIPADRPMFFVFSKTNASTGCTIVHAPKGSPRYAPERVWQGGFYDPCQFGEWDYAGRSIKQFAEQDEAARRPDLEVPALEAKDRFNLRVIR